MALLERVGTLLRANLNDMIDRAEDPAKMIKQVILDMENQLMQVKTQVAISIADLHLLERKSAENTQKQEDYKRKAELAVAKGDDNLARAALERALDAGKLASSFVEQIADQKVQVENLKTALRSLDSKLQEAKAKSDLLLATQRRARTAMRAADAQGSVNGTASTAAWDRMKGKVNQAEALAHAHTELLGDNIEARFAQLEKQDEVDRLLAEIKTKRLT